MDRSAPRSFLRYLVPLALGAVLIPAARGADWPRWRGPHGDGTTPGGGIFEREHLGLELVWSRDLGSAYSGIAVIGDRVVTMFSDGESDWVVALGRDSGDELWRHRIDAMHAGHDGSDDGPIGMPVVDGETVYGLGPRGRLFAVRLGDGSELWSIDLTERVGAVPPFYGFATMPLVVDDLLFVQTGGSAGRGFTGFDKRTGEVRWSVGDEPVTYQSPALLSLAGERQIVAVGNRRVFGLRPATGEVLWSHEHSPQGEDGSSQPMAIGEDRVLLNGLTDSVLLRVTRTDDGFAAEEVWRTRELKGTHAAPVLHGDHLYGFDGEFLTCVDAASGERVWKSRPPGGKGLILVDDHLVIFAPRGEVVVARASPEGYEEAARLRVSERAGYTWPSFADGRIFVRDLNGIASVRVTEAAPVETAAGPGTPAAPRPPPSDAFEAFVRRVEAAENKRLLVDAFMNEQARFPIVEGNRLVHFVYRGRVEDIAITGSMTEFRVEEPMERIEGTDVYYKTFAIEPGARWEYRYNVDFDNLVPDPLNPRRVPGSRGDASELLMPGFEPPGFVKPYTGPTPGMLESFRHASELLGNEREITVYLPHGYADSRRRYPLLVVTEGDEWLGMAAMANSLHHLIGDRIAPLVVAFVHNAAESARDEIGGSKTESYVRMLAEELLPRLEERYRLESDPGSRAILGYGTGGLVAARAVLTRPRVFGGAAVASAYLPGEPGQEVLRLAGEGPARGRFYVTWNRYELRRAEWNFDLGADSRRLREALERGGHEVAGGEVLDGSGWGAWRARVGDMLAMFFPG